MMTILSVIQENWQKKARKVAFSIKSHTTFINNLPINLYIVYLILLRNILVIITLILSLLISIIRAILKRAN